MGGQALQRAVWTQAVLGGRSRHTQHIGPLSRQASQVGGRKPAERLTRQSTFSFGLTCSSTVVTWGGGEEQQQGLLTWGYLLGMVEGTLLPTHPH